MAQLRTAWKGLIFRKCCAPSSKKAIPCEVRNSKPQGCCRNLSLHLCAKVKDETFSGIKCWGVRSLLDTMTPEDGGNCLMVLCPSNPKMPGPPAGMAPVVQGCVGLGWLVPTFEEDMAQWVLLQHPSPGRVKPSVGFCISVMMIGK